MARVKFSQIIPFFYKKKISPFFCLSSIHALSNGKIWKLHIILFIRNMFLFSTFMLGREIFRQTDKRATFQCVSIFKVSVKCGHGMSEN